MNSKFVIGDYQKFMNFLDSYLVKNKKKVSIALWLPWDC